MNPFIFLYFFLINQTQRQRQRPLVKPEALERSRSNGSDSWSIPERSLSGNLDMNSLLSEFTEYLRLSLLPLPPLLLAPRIGVFRSAPSISRCVSASVCSYFCSVFVSVFISHSTHTSCHIIISKSNSGAKSDNISVSFLFF